MTRAATKVSTVEEQSLAEALDLVRQEDWAAWSMFPSTEWYQPDSLPQAFETLAAATTQEVAQVVYSQMMEALCHNHSGWVYAAAVPGASHLARLVTLLPPLPQDIALEVLGDLLNFAVREQSFNAPNGVDVATDEAIREAVAHLVPTVASWQAEGEGPRRPGAEAFLDALRDDG